MLSRDSEDKMWSRFVIWPQEVTLARWTQPSGLLCLWQCFTISLNGVIVLKSTYRRWSKPWYRFLCPLKPGRKEPGGCEDNPPENEKSTIFFGGITRIYYVSIQGWQIAIHKNDSLGANSGRYVPIKGGVLKQWSIINSTEGADMILIKKLTKLRQQYRRSKWGQRLLCKGELGIQLHQNEARLGGLSAWEMSICFAKLNICICQCFITNPKYK